MQNKFLLNKAMFTEKEKKKIEKYYEKGNDYYNSIEHKEDKTN